MIDLTDIIQAAIVLILTLIFAKVLPWVKGYILPWIEAHTTEKQRKAMQIAYNTAVFAAEQLLGAGKGEEKLDYAIKYLESKGYTVDRAQIEATVKKYFGHNLLPGGNDEDSAADDEPAEEDEEPQTPLM